MRCEHFGECGGCQAQHIEYGVQLHNKKRKICELLGLDDIDVFYGEPFGYRSRMDFTFTKRGLGLRRKKRWDSVVNIKGCAISNPRLNELVVEVNECFRGVDAFDLVKKTGTYRYAVIRTPPEDSSISFVLDPASRRISEALEKIEKFSKKTSASNIIVTYSENDESVSDDYFVVKGRDVLSTRVLGNRFLFPVQGFFQNNPEVCEKMHSFVNEKLEGGNHLIDLYGGVGTFGINNAEKFKKVSVVESSKAAFSSCLLNIRDNKATNTSAECMSANKFDSIIGNGDISIIADPPRKGLDVKTVDKIRRSRPGSLVYVSCNPLELRKDLRKLKEYRLEEVALFDMFPQTHHIETIVKIKSQELRKNKEKTNR